MSSPIAHTPLIRILLPFGLGILFSFYTSIGLFLPFAIIAVSTTSLLAILYSTKSDPVIRLHFRSAHIIPLFLISFSLGCIDGRLEQPKEIDLNSLNGKYITGTICSLSNTDLSMKMVVRNSSFGDILVTTNGCDYTLNEGDIVTFKANLRKVSNWGNPQEFDYAKYLYTSGIAYSQHIKVGKISMIGRSSNPIYTIKKSRLNIENKILSSNLSEDAKKFIIAILLGNNKHLDKDVRTTFSQAGAAHILALSGLHIGVIVLLIWWFLFPLDYLHLKKTRLCITLVAIATYALFTGLSPSVARATIMVSFTFVAYLFYRRNNMLNALFGAALLILALSPFSIFSISFQLSFISVGFLAVFSATVLPKIKTKNSLVKYIISSIAVSLIATAATAAITAYYFHTISLLSFISNIIILPWLPLFMIIAVAFVFTLSLNGEVMILTKTINFTYDTIYSIVTAVSRIPLSHIDDVYVSFTFVILIYVFLFIICLFLFTKRKILVIAALATAIVATSYHIIDVNNRCTRGFVVFNSFKCTPVFYFNNSHGYLWCPDDSLSADDFKKSYAPFISYHKIDSIHIVRQNITLDEAKIFQPYASVFGNNLVVLANGKWKHYKSQSRIDVDYAIITKRYHSDIATLLQLYNPKRIVLAGDLYEDRHDELKSEILSKNKNYYSIKHEGAICFYE